MAKVNLLPRKEFEIILEDGSRINGMYGTWMVKRYGELKGLSLEEILSKEDEEKNIPLSQKMDDAALLLLCAVEYSCRLKRDEFNYDLVNAYSWIDELGGITGEKVVKLFAHSKDEVPAVKKKAAKN